MTTPAKFVTAFINPQTDYASGQLFALDAAGKLWQRDASRFGRDFWLQVPDERVTGVEYSKKEAGFLFFGAGRRCCIDEALPARYLRLRNCLADKDDDPATWSATPVDAVLDFFDNPLALLQRFAELGVYLNNDDFDNVRAALAFEYARVRATVPWLSKMFAPEQQAEETP